MSGKPLPNCIEDQYLMFKKGDVNPKGGNYSMNHLSRVLLKDELLEGVVTDETRCYFRVRVDKEKYPNHTDGRLKSKHYHLVASLTDPLWQCCNFRCECGHASQSFRTNALGCSTRQCHAK